MVVSICHIAIVCHILGCHIVIICHIVIYVLCVSLQIQAQNYNDNIKFYFVNWIPCVN